MFGKCYKVCAVSMLNGCSFPGCVTLTLSAYCLEHELFLDAQIEAVQAQGPEDHEGQPTTAAAWRAQA
jgi:hypothetical protein